MSYNVHNFRTGDTIEAPPINEMDQQIKTNETNISNKLDKPSTAGTNGQVLTSDGNGGQIWQTPVQDVKINGTSILNQGVANVPLADASTPGAVMIPTSDSTLRGVKLDSSGLMTLVNATSSDIKSPGSSVKRPIVPDKQHEATFYGLAKAAGDSSQASSSNATGVYTDDAKGAIQHMIGTSDVVAPVETDITADRAYSVGEHFMYAGKLYKVTSAIAQGGTITPGVNCEIATVSGEIEGIIDDTAGAGDTDVTFSADKLTAMNSSLLNAISAMNTATASAVDKALSPKTVTNGKVTEWQFKPISGGSAVLNYVTPEDFGAEGDGVTDDSQAVQDACDAGYAVYFASNKTYYLANTVTIDHDVHLFGGEGTVIKTKTPTGGTVNDAFAVSGTLKKTTTLTTDYSANGSTANSGNKFTLSDVTGINIGDIMIITAEDQYYSYSREYYYLGATLLVSDIYDGHIYTDIGMPWDIENTQDVSVTVYSAPTIIVENLSFVSDLDSRGHYKYFFKVNHAKNCIFRNCDMTQMDNGIQLNFCYNSLIDNVKVSKSKYDNNLSSDGYGIYIGSCTHTIVQRVTAICSQGCVDLSGTLPNIDTFFYNCYLNSECRTIGIDMHENGYNTVIEDSTLGGASLYGTATVNRCRIIKNMRAGGDCGINIRGSHNPEWAIFKINDCDFVLNSTGVNITRPIPQDPIQAFDNVFGSIEITNCKNGHIEYEPTVTSDITANIINRLVIRNWQDCEQIYYKQGNHIKFLEISGSNFTKSNFILNTTSNQFDLSGIGYLDYQSINPLAHKMYINGTTYGENLILPENVSIQLSSNSQDAKFIVCGSNITPDNASDYSVGLVSGEVGGSLTRTVATGSNLPSISFDASGNLVYSQGSQTSQYYVYPVGMVYAKEQSTISVSATLINSGQTSGATFRPYIAIVSCKTGLVTYCNNGTAQTATSQGVTISQSRNVPADSVAMCYFYCNSPVASAESTFGNLSITLTPVFAPAPADEDGYKAKRLTGDGTLNSFAGVNNIISSETTFSISLVADYLNSPIAGLPTAVGVSF